MAAPLNIPSAANAQTVSVNGGNLFRLALNTLGDALQWTRIANANRIVDPFLPAGSPLTLIIPPVNSSAANSGVLQSSNGVPIFAVETGVLIGVPINISPPTIFGNPQAGQELVATPGAWLNNPTSFTYQWIDEGTGAIAGAVSEAFTPGPSDVGAGVMVSVVAANAAGQSVPAISIVTTAIIAAQVNAPVNLIPPHIMGVVQVGQQLMATTGTWANSPVSYSYQWFDSSSGAIAGATGMTYIPVSGNVGHTLTVVVTAANSAGTSSTPSAATTSIISTIPANTGLPTITGTAQVGQTLTASPGAWTNSPVNFVYQWFDSSTGAISGANSSTYVPIESDLGNPISVSVIAINAGGASSPVMSVATAAIVQVGLPANVTLPTVLGIGQVGQTITADPGIWTNSPTFTYQWYRDTTAIAGQTASTYAPVTADISHAINVTVTGTNFAGSASATNATLPFGGVFLTTLGGAPPTLIYSLPGQEVNHAHQSPGSGRYIAMSSYTVSPFVEGASYLGTEILLLDTTTGITNTVVPAVATQNNSNPEWWPDGLSFLYSSSNMAGGPNPTKGGARRYFPATGVDQIFYNPNMKIADFSVSPGGAVVVGGQTTINGFITDALFVYYNGVLTQLTTPNITSNFNPSGDFDPQWSPSGNYISLSRAISPGMFTIVIVHVGPAPTFANLGETIISPPGSAAAFDGLAPWSDSDQYIITWYQDPANRAANGIYYMNKDGSGRTRLNLQSQAQFYTPAFVPGSGFSSSAQVLYSTLKLPIFPALPVDSVLPMIST